MLFSGLCLGDALRLGRFGIRWVLGGFGGSTVGGVLGGGLRVSFGAWFGYFGGVGVVGFGAFWLVVAGALGVCCTLVMWMLRGSGWVWV